MLLHNFVLSSYIVSTAKTNKGRVISDEISIRLFLRNNIVEAVKSSVVIPQYFASSSNKTLIKENLYNSNQNVD